MESLIQEISDRLHKERLEWEAEIEQDQKNLAAKTYECIGACFRKPGSMEESNHCAAECQVGMNKAMSKLQTRLNNMQNQLQTCMQSCGLKSANAEDDELRGCLNKCADDVSAKLMEMKQISKDIINKYI